MNIKHLEFFACVAKLGSINKAAQELYISQPHLSNIIKDMEADVGLSLFARTKQGVTLTQDGQKFLQHSSVILKEMQELKSFSVHTKLPEDKMKISMTRFSHTMESFNEICKKHQSEKNFTYRLNEGTTMEVTEDILSGDCDVGVIHCTTQELEQIKALIINKGMEFTHIAGLAPHICLSENHEILKNGEQVTLEKLKNYGFVRYYGQYEDYIYHAASKNQQNDLNNSNKIAYVQGRSALMSLIADTNFYTIGIQGFSSQLSRYGVVSIKLQDCAEKIEFAVIKRRGDNLSIIEKEFIQDVSKRYKLLQEK